MTCAGCTDEAACNYDAEATLDDGSCEAPDALTGCGDTCLDGGVLYEFNISDQYSVNRPLCRHTEKVLTALWRTSEVDRHWRRLRSQRHRAGGAP